MHVSKPIQFQSHTLHLGASLAGGFSPRALRLVYDRMLAWMVPSSTYPDGQLALVVQARGRLLLVFLFRRSRVVAQGKCRVGGSAETLQCKRQIQAFPTSSQPHPQGAPRGDVTCTTTVLLQWNLARGARELQSRLEYVPVPVVIPKKRSGTAKTNTAQLCVMSAGNRAAPHSERHPVSNPCQPGHSS